MTEKIGNVKLNLEFYSGEDSYCDGEDIENEILEIVEKHPKSHFNKIIFEKKKWPILYHLSNTRGNIINWIDFEENSNLLEIGAGCGAITEALVEKPINITAIDLSKKRCLINAYRNKSKENLEIIVGNFNDIKFKKKYDYITLIGVYEYAGIYMKSENPYIDFMNNIMEHLKPQGKLIIAIENKYGLKYWAGCMEDHLGDYFKNLEGYQEGNSVRTFSKKEWIRIFEACNIKKYKFYYPYPDYKFPYSIYSDERLPKKNELSDTYPNFDLPRLKLFDENKVLNSIIEDELFDLYSNSYLIIVDKDDK